MPRGHLSLMNVISQHSKRWSPKAPCHEHMCFKSLCWMEMSGHLPYLANSSTEKSLVGKCEPIRLTALTDSICCWILQFNVSINPKKVGLLNTASVWGIRVRSWNSLIPYASCQNLEFVCLPAYNENTQCSSMTFQSVAYTKSVKHISCQPILVRTLEQKT
jgi:hypothetical protein